MGQQKYVVQYNNQTDLYLTVFNPNYDLCQWGSLENALTFNTMEDAQYIAAMIDNGTVGTVRPH